MSKRTRDEYDDWYDEERELSKKNQKANRRRQRKAFEEFDHSETYEEIVRLSKSRGRY
jgi:hypothetical protein